MHECIDIDYYKLNWKQMKCIVYDSNYVLYIEKQIIFTFHKFLIMLQ